MKNKLKLLVITFVILLSTVTFADSVVNDTLTVDESNILRTSDKMLLGINDQWNVNKLYVEDNATGIVSKKFINTIKDVDMPISLSRMAGTESKKFRWKETIGEQSERGYYGDDTYGEKYNFGMVEWLNTIKEINPNASFVFCVNLMLDTPTDHADLVRFLTLEPNDPKAVDENGFNWAQRRVDLGIEKPLKMAVFELGNEMDYVTYNNSTEVANRANWYIGLCNDAINAMREVNPNIKFSALLYTTPHENSTYAKVWNSAVISALGENINYVSLHHYYHGSNNYYLQVSRLNNEIFAYINQLPEGKRPTVFISEHSIWVDTSQSTNVKKKVSALWGTLRTGQLINQMANRGDIAMMTYHSMNDTLSSDDSWNTAWGVVRPYDDGNDYVTGIGELLKIYSIGFGDGKAGEYIVDNTLVGDPTYYQPSASGINDLITVTAHTTAQGGLNLVICNQNEEVSHNLTFKANKKYRLLKEAILTSNDIYANNLPKTPEALYTKVNFINSNEEFTNYVMPTKSIVVLQLVPINEKYENENAEIKFKDTREIRDDIPYVNCTDGVFDVTARLYNNGNMKNVGNLSALVYNDDVDYNNLTFDNILYIDQAEIKRDLVHFNIKLPEDSQSGFYNIAIGNRSNDKNAYQIKKFYLDIKNTSNTNIAISNLSDNGIIDNVEHNVDVLIDFDKNFGVGKSFSVVIKNSITDEIVSIAKATREEGIKQIVKMKMPTDVISGKYKVVLQYIDDDKKNISQKEFDYIKPNEKLSIINNPVDEDENIVNLSDIKNVKNISFSIKNNTDTAKNCGVFVGIYNNSGRLIKMCKSTSLTVADETMVTVPIGLDTTDSVNTAKIYVWDNSDPQTYVYRIK